MAPSARGRWPARALLLAALLAPGLARADVWSEAKQAAVGKAPSGPFSPAFVHRIVLQSLMARRTEGSTPKVKERLRAAATLLKLHGGATSHDAAVRYDTGFVLAALEQCDAAIPAFHHALWYAPAHVQAARAWFHLGICHALRAEADEEEVAWSQALALDEDPQARHVILANLAETRMRLGRLDDALVAIEDAIEIEPQNPTPHWTRAMVLDRLDDRAGALAAARVALSLDPLGGSLDSEGVFFVPPYDRHWYHALVCLAQADQSVGVVAAALRRDALDRYTKWFEAAAVDDPFRALAEKRIKQLEAQLKKP